MIASSKLLWKTIGNHQNKSSNQLVGSAKIHPEMEWRNLSSIIFTNRGPPYTLNYHYNNTSPTIKIRSDQIAQMSCILMPIAIVISGARWLPTAVHGLGMPKLSRRSQVF